MRTARAAVAKVHQVSGLGDPTADGLCKDVLRRIGREGRDRGRGQVAGIGWAHAEAAASLASNGSGGLQGLRDAAIIRVMSDTLARISEIAALRCAAVEAAATGRSSAPRSPISRAKGPPATSGRPRSPRSTATAKRPSILQGRCSARCAGVDTPAPIRWAPTASAPEQATARAGGWKSSRMVAHYSAAVAAEQGAVSKYL